MIISLWDKNKFLKSLKRISLKVKHLLFGTKQSGITIVNQHQSSSKTEDMIIDLPKCEKPKEKQVMTLMFLDVKDLK